MKRLIRRTAVVVSLVAAGPGTAGRHLLAGPAEAGRHVQPEGPAEAGRYVQPAADPHPTFTVGTATARRGQKAYGVLKVPAGYDMPVVVVHGAKPGPVLAVAAGAHGSEYASIIAVEMLIESVKADEVAGTLILLPIINVPSFERITPHVNPTDNKSMNRFYP